MVAFDADTVDLTIDGGAQGRAGALSIFSYQA